MSEQDAIVVHVTAPTVIEEAPAAAVAEAGPAEPEVISKGKKEEEEGEAAEGEEKAPADKKAPEKKAPEEKKKPEEKK